jgi:hypothetical protein
MRICDLIETYINAILIRNDASLYEQARPELFEHYHTFWSKKRPYRRDWDAATLRGQRELVHARLIRLDACFAALSLEVAELEIVLFVGHGTTNGHAFRENGRFVVWIPIETYTDPLYTDVFLTHEIAHALHYERTPAFYFETVEEKDRISRMLITEALATYLTRAVLGQSEGDSLWGGYLPQEKLVRWMDECERRCPEICAFLARNFDCSLSEHGLFCLYDTEAIDVFCSRGGYFAGLRVIQTIARGRGLTVADLLLLDRQVFEGLVREQLTAASP